jgi:hypothetical protein
MNIIELKEREAISENVKTSKVYLDCRKLLKELVEKELPDKFIEFVNQNIEDLNSTALSDNKLRKLVRQKQAKILKLLEKELKIVPKNYYRNTLMAIGMSLIGAPIGFVFWLITGNIVFIGAGVPIGMVLGIFLGSRMDKKASDEGRQLDVEVKF